MNILVLMPILITLCGTYFLFKLRFFYIAHPIKTLRKATASLKEKGAFLSFSLALAGTLGIGNIIGVGVGLSVGGAGSVFWLFVSSLFSMILKFSEAALSAEVGCGEGMLGIIRSAFGKASAKISSLYALLLLILCFFMGAALQSASACDYAFTSLGLSPYKSGIMLLFVVFVSLLIGSKKIEKITSIIIPLTTLIYIMLCIGTIILNFTNLPSALLRVMKGAFSFDSASGGLIGFITSEKIKEGYLRGILSNEAGTGTSTIAHSLNTSRDSGAVGVVAMLEVVFDTVILCMLTAFSALVCIDDFSEMSGIGVIYHSIGSAFATLSEYLLFVSVFAFAYSTVVCWYYYGRFAYKYLFGCSSELPFAFLFLLSVLFGCVFGTELLIGTVDTVLLFLSLISLGALIKNSDRIKALSERSGLI